MTEFDRAFLRALLLPVRLPLALVFWLLAYSAVVPLLVGWGPRKVKQYLNGWN